MPCRVRPLLLILGALAIVACAGCQVDATVTVTADRSGAGIVNVRVVLDRDAADQLGDPGTTLRLDDLRAAGWTVDSPRTGAALTTLNASKRFASPGELQGVLDEVGGRDGVFRKWSMRVDDRFASTAYLLGGSVHLTGALDQFSDADVAKALDGLPLGRTAAELNDALGAKKDRVDLTVRVEAPDAAEAERTFTIGDGAPHDDVVAASAEITDGAPVRWFILAGACVLVAGLLVVVPRVRRS